MNLYLKEYIGCNLFHKQVFRTLYSTCNCIKSKARPLLLKIRGFQYLKGAKIKGSETPVLGGGRKLKGRKLKGAEIQGRRKLKGIRYSPPQ